MGSVARDPFPNLTHKTDFVVIPPQGARELHAVGACKAEVPSRRSPSGEALLCDHAAQDSSRQAADSRRLADLDELFGVRHALLQMVRDRCAHVSYAGPVGTQTRSRAMGPLCRSFTRWIHRSPAISRTPVHKRRSGLGERRRTFQARLTGGHL